MIVDNNQGGVASVTMTKFEARVLHDALTMAKIQIGPGISWAPGQGVDIEHLRETLIGIAKS